MSENIVNGKLAKIARDPALRMVGSIIFGIFILGTIYATRNSDVETNSDNIVAVEKNLVEHADDEVLHMEAEEMSAIAVNKILVDKNISDIMDVKEEHEKDIERILEAMDKGFTGVKDYIDIMHRGD